MAKNPKLTVIFSANTKGFERGVKRSTSLLRRFGSAAGKLAKVGLIAFAAGIALATFQLVRMVKSQFSALDKVAKLSDRIGIQTQKLAGLELAASQSGVANEVFVKSIEKMQKVIGDAIFGLSSAKDAFDAMGLSFEEVSKKGTLKQFFLITDAINAIDNASVRAKVSADLFGRAGGKELRNLLAIGSQGMRDFIKEANRLGHAFTRTDLAKIEAANDAIDKLGKSIKAAAGHISIELSIALEALGSTATNMTGLVTAGFEGIQTAVLAAIVSLDRWELAVLKVQRFLGRGSGFGGGEGVPGATTGKQRMRIIGPDGKPLDMPTPTINTKFAPASESAIDLRIRALETGQGRADALADAIARAQQSFLGRVGQRMISQTRDGGTIGGGALGGGDSLGGMLGRISTRSTSSLRFNTGIITISTKNPLLEEVKKFRKDVKDAIQGQNNPVAIGMGV